MIQINGVSKSYKSTKENRVIFDNMYLEINNEEKIAIVGANGSGKSTFLKLLLGQVQPDSGSINILVPYNDVVYLPQDYRNSLFPWLTVRSNLALLLNEESDSFFDLHLSKEKEAKIKDILNILKVNINFEKYPYQLSGGEQQGLLFVHAVLRTPKLLIADEPFSAIDFHKRELFESFFSSWSFENKITTIVVSHSLEEAVYLANRVIILTRENTTLKNDFSVNFQFPRDESLKFHNTFQEIVSYIKSNFE